MCNAHHLGSWDEAAWWTRRPCPALRSWLPLVETKASRVVQIISQRLIVEYVVNCGFKASDLWPRGSGDARWTGQASYSSLALVALRRSSVGKVIIKSDGNDFAKKDVIKELGTACFFFLPFHLESRAQVTPLVPGDLELLAHPEHTHTQWADMSSLIHQNRGVKLDHTNGQNVKHET